MKPSVRHALACIAVAAVAVGCGNPSETELIAQARASLDKRDPAAAIIQLKNALDRKPDSAEARLLLGTTLLQTGDAAAALIELEKARASGAPAERVVPAMARALLASGQGARLVAEHESTELGDPAAAAELKISLALAHAAGGDLDRAREAAEAALQARPHSAGAAVLLARLDAGGGRTDEALQRLEAVLAREAGDEPAALLKAEIQLRARRQPDAAAATLRALLAARADSVTARVALVNLLLERRDVEAARTEFALLDKAAPKHRETQFLRAVFDYHAKQYAASREAVDALLAKSPNDPRLLMLGASAELALNRASLAEGLLSRLLKASPGHVPARQLLARAHLAAGAPDKAVEVLQPVVDSAGADADSLSLAGEAQLRAGDIARAEQLFKRALAARPDDPALRTGLARAQLFGGNEAQAVSQLEHIARSDPAAQADLMLVAAKARRGDHAGALAALDGVERKTPGQPFTSVIRGRLLEAKGDRAAAARAYEAALQREPGHFPAVAALAALDLAEGRADAARKRFEGLVKADPRNARATLALAELDARAGAPEAVILARLREAIKADPAWPGARLALVNRLLGSGEAQDAVVAAQDAAAALPENLAILDALGRAQQASGDSQRAVSTFKRLASLMPRSADAQLRLAEAHRAAGERAPAAQALRRALDLDPGMTAAQRGLALIAVADKRPGDALAIARTLQQRQPKDPAGWVLEAEIESLQKQWPAAAAAYQKALERQRSSALAARLHRVLLAGGRTADAERMASGWMKEHPKDADFQFHLADVASAASDWPRAEAAYRAVLAIQPRHPAALNNVAWLMATQRKSGAVDAAQQALAMTPDRAPLLDTLSLAYESEGRHDKALEAQRRAVELAPRDPAMRLRLARLLVHQGQKKDARETLEGLVRLGKGFAGQAEVSELLGKL